MKDLSKIENPLETPFGYTISMISGKWKLIIFKLKNHKRY